MWLFFKKYNHPQFFAQLMLFLSILGKSFALGIHKKTILFEFSVGDGVYLIASPVTFAEALEHC